MDQQSKQLTVCIEGMTCRSCELLIERKWKQLDCVCNVEVEAATGKARITHNGTVPSVTQLQEALGQEKYIVSLNGTGIKPTKTSFLELLGLFALVLLLGNILSSFGLFNTSFTIGSGMSLGAIFVVGLVAASSSCIAISGGLLLSAAATFNARYNSARPMARMRPVLLFVAGRIIGYTVLGGLLGVVGQALAPSPIVTSMIGILAAVYMIIMGLDMLQIAPTWLKGLMPKIPKSIANRVLDADGNTSPFMPMVLGAATFFLPCGFTQALQLYALTTGSFTTAALSLGVFALGTAPALLALGWASSSLKGKAGTFFFKFSGALVIILGLWNIQNSLAIAGFTVTPSPSSVRSGATNFTPATAPTVGGVQTIKMAVTQYGYEPSHFTIRAGVPVRWEIDATNGGGCGSVLVSRQLGIQKLLSTNPLNVIEFTPSITGEIPFSCSMGMYRGSFTILPAV